VEEVAEGRWLSLQEAAGELHVSLNTLRRRVKDGEITARKIDRKQGYRYEVLVPGTTWISEEVPDGDPGTSRVPPEQLEALRDALQIVDRLTRENLELAGRVGFLQAQLPGVQERIALLEAPPLPPIVENAAASGPPRPWWRFWIRAQ
jgi:hypothetical protein